MDTVWGSTHLSSCESLGRIFSLEGWEMGNGLVGLQKTGGPSVQEFFCTEL